MKSLLDFIKGPWFIAVYTWREGLRRKTLVGFLILSLLVIFGATFMTSFINQATVGDVSTDMDLKLIKDIKPNVIFHLAGQVAMTTSIQNPYFDFEINVKGSLNILESVRLYSPESIILYSSTNKVYGDLEQFNYRELEKRYECVEYPKGFDESIPLDFHSPYGCSKGAADQYMLDYYRMFGIRTVVFRHSSMYGGRQFATYDQ